MTAWLRDDAGIAMLVCALIAFFAFIAIAFVVEYIKAAPLRRQKRKTAALQRYCNLVDRQAASLLRSIREAGEA